MLLLLLIVSLLAYAGCGSESRIEFHICAELDVPKELDALRISILDEALQEQRFALIELTRREMVAEGGVTNGATSDRDRQSGSQEPNAESASKAETDTQNATTRSLPITPSLKGESGPGYLRVQALLEGVEVARFDRQIPDLEKTTAVDMPLTKGCYGKTNCSLGQTCVGDRCIVAPIGAAPPACD